MGNKLGQFYNESDEHRIVALTDYNMINPNQVNKICHNNTKQFWKMWNSTIVEGFSLKLVLGKFFSFLFLFITVLVKLRQQQGH
jgi:hypothetical protein